MDWPHLRDDLRGDVAGRREAMRALDERAGDDGAVLQHVLEVHEIAVVHVLGEIVRIMEVDEALVVRLHHVLRQQHALGEVLGHLARHVIALHGVHRGVLVGVLLLDLFVVAFDKREDLVVGGVLGALQPLHVAVDDVLAGDLELIELHELVFVHILDLFDGDRVPGVLARLRHVLRRIDDLALGEAIGFLHVLVGCTDGVLDLGDIESDFDAAALDDLHEKPFW